MRDWALLPGVHCYSDSVQPCSASAQSSSSPVGAVTDGGRCASSGLQPWHAPCASQQPQKRAPGLLPASRRAGAGLSSCRSSAPVLSFTSILGKKTLTCWSKAGFGPQLRLLVWRNAAAQVMPGCPLPSRRQQATA